MEGFIHTKAQIFEFDYHHQMMKEHFKRFSVELAEYKKQYKGGLNPQTLSEMWEGNFFDIKKETDLKEMELFIEHIRDKKCLDIGCGWAPYTRYIWTCGQKYMIDPLVSKYKEMEHSSLGYTFFDDAIIYSIGAEEIIPELINSIDGFIFCRNAIDHSEDPLAILNAISEYAMKGCYLLFWSDIWIPTGGDVGHRCITKSIPVFNKLFNGLGFKKIISLENNPVRKKNETTEYGGVFIKE